MTALSVPAPRRLNHVVAELTALLAQHEPNEANPGSVGAMVWHLICARMLNGTVESSRLAAWFRCPRPESHEADLLLDDIDLDPSELGVAFERTALLRLGGTSKRDTGTYYTPGPLAGLLVEETIRSLRRSGRPPKEWRIVDPACGAGAFAIEVVRQTANVFTTHHGLDERAALDHALVHTTYLVDSDPLAVAVARCVLLALYGTDTTDLEALERHTVAGDAVVGGPNPALETPATSGVRWRESFPEVFGAGGFDAVVGNPPWGAIKPALREYAATLDPSLLRLDGKALRVSTSSLTGAREVAGRQRAYSAQLRAAGYQHQGGGDTEFYRYFMELSLGLLRRGGVLGLIVPSAVQRTVGAAPLRRLLLRGGSIEVLLDFINNQAIFDIHRMFRFSLVVWRQGGDAGIKQLRFGLTDVEEARRALIVSGVRMTSGYLASVSPRRLTIPDVRDGEEASLYSRLHAAQPALGEAGVGPWDVRFRRELDMTNDLSLFIATPHALAEGARQLPDGSWHHPKAGELLPVFEGRMVQQFDAMAKGYVSGHGRSAVWEDLEWGRKAIRPRYLVRADDAERRGIPRMARAGFCDVTGHANERTVLAALVPAVGACGNKVPTCRFSDDHPDLPLLWVAVANSFVLNWIARRRVSTTLNFFHWEEMPFPRLEPRVGTGRQLAADASRLSAVARGPEAVGLAERAVLRTRIEVAVAAAYGVDLRAAVVIFRDFPLLDRRAPDGHNTVTRDSVLAALADAGGFANTRLSELGLKAHEGPDGLAERVEWHGAAGAVPYIAGEGHRRRHVSGAGRFPLPPNDS